MAHPYHHALSSVKKWGVPLVTLEEDGFQRYRRSKLQIVKELGERLQTEGDPTKHGIMMAAVLL